MKLSESRKQAIYNAVTNEIMNARIELVGKAAMSMVSVVTIHAVLSRAQDKAGQAAIEAAGGVARTRALLH